MKPSITNVPQRGSVSPLNINYLLTKYIITGVLLIAVVLNGLTGYHFFQHSAYGLSNLMIISSYLSIVMSIYVLTMSKRRSTIEME